MYDFNGTNDPAPVTDVPNGDSVDTDAWRMAEELVRSRNGGFAGVGEHEKSRQIREAYDQLVDSNKKATDWEGK